MGKQVQINSPAQDFELQDFNGMPGKLSDYQGKTYRIERVHSSVVEK